MSTILKETNVKRTRNKCRCDWCGEIVNSGEPSLSMAAVWDGDFSTTRYHPECHKAWQETDWQEYEEWIPCDQYRGKPLGFEPSI